MYTVANDGFGKTTYTMGCDVGAHIDSPGHFILDARTVADITPAELTARSAVIDVTSKVEADPTGNYGLTIADVEEWETKHGQIPDRSLVVMKTGWDSRMGTPEYAN